MNERLGKVHFWVSVVFITLVFGGQLLAGYAGQQRRLFDPFQYAFLQHLRGLNRWTSYFAFVLGAASSSSSGTSSGALVAGEKAERRTRGRSARWSGRCPSPPPHHNFDVIPTVVRGPHEFANPEVSSALGRDWIGQAEDLPEERDVPVASPAHG